MHFFSGGSLVEESRFVEIGFWGMVDMVLIW